MRMIGLYTRNIYRHVFLSSVQILVQAAAQVGSEQLNAARLIIAKYSAQLTSSDIRLKN
jgi:ribosomal protein L16/L10AE